MKYFITSDIHGHYNEMIHALKHANYDENNVKHKLVVAGDLFDRGYQSKEVLYYLYRLNIENKAIILKGNHEVFLEDLFSYDSHSVQWNIKHNGFFKTLKSFIPDIENYSLSNVINCLNSNYPWLEPWIRNLPYFLETEQYIITHAGLDFSERDWKKGNWKKAIWCNAEQFFKLDLKTDYNINKIVVVGHRMTNKIRQHFLNTKDEDFSIYYHSDGQKIGIDGGCYYSKKINVLTFEE